MNLALRVGFYDESWKQKEIPHVIWQIPQLHPYLKTSVV